VLIEESEKSEKSEKLSSEER